MGILATLRKDGAGEWLSLPDYLREVRHRDADDRGRLRAVDLGMNLRLRMNGGRNQKKEDRSFHRNLRWTPRYVPM